MMTRYSRRHWLAWLAASAAAPVLLGACGRKLDPAADFWWQQRLSMLDGSALPTASLHGKPLLLNFWASWCPPCIREMPLLNAFYQQHRASGWNVLGVAIDKPDAVRDFLQRQPVQFPIAIAEDDGMEWMQKLGNDRNSLPFTLQFDQHGQIVERHLGQVDAELLERWFSSTAAVK